MKNYFTIISFTILMSSCDAPICHNSNPIFDNNPVESKSYQDEVVKQLKTTDDTELIYTLKDYVEKEGTTFLYIGIHDNRLCATAVVKVTDWNSKLEGIRKTKGVGYHGAILKNLQFQIVEDSLKTELVYKDLETIID